MRFGFVELRLHRIELQAAEGNGASIRVAQKLGFVREGLRRAAGRGIDGRHDEYIFGLLAHEFAGAP
ncbi:MAG: GNAT family N-acetyltransferase [Actinomycetota bacterium]